jgi:hypothetical protein
LAQPEHVHYTSVQFIVKFDLWNEPETQGDVSLAEIRMGWTGVLVLH